MSKFFTWTFLATFAGAALATSILTQAIKGVFEKIPTQIVSYIIALAILLLATLFTNSAASPGDWVLTVINAVLFSLSSNGAFDAVKRVAG